LETAYESLLNLDDMPRPSLVDALCARNCVTPMWYARLCIDVGINKTALRTSSKRTG
jgi:hypothetical protein